MSFRAIKNLGLALLLAIQVVLAALAYVQVEDKQQEVDLLATEIVARFETLERVNRSLTAAANLFFYDTIEGYISIDSLLSICEQGSVIASRLQQLNAGSPRLAQLEPIGQAFSRLTIALEFYAEADKQLTSDREILAQMILSELAGTLSR